MGLQIVYEEKVYEHSFNLSYSTARQRDKEWEGNLKNQGYS